jgi:hypothetical protein
MKKETLKKINRCKALQTATIADIVRGERFRKNLAAYMAAQREDREQIRASYEAMKKVGGAKGYKLPAHPIDRVIGMTAEDFGEEYLRIISHKSNKPVAQREYIFQLARQAYNLTVAQIICDEFPELRDELLPKSKES